MVTGDLTTMPMEAVTPLMFKMLNRKFKHDIMHNGKELLQQCIQYMYARMCMCMCMGAIIGSVWQGSGSSYEAAILVEQDPFCKMFGKTASPVGLRL